MGHRWGIEASKVESNPLFPQDFSPLPVLRPGCKQDGGAGVGRPRRMADAEGVEDQVRSIQMVFSSVYFSIACSDLSRPKPDCL